MKRRKTSHGMATKDRSCVRYEKPRKLNMQPIDDADAAQYEANAREYFESIREPYEQTLRTIRKKAPTKWVVGIIYLIALVGVLAIPFASSHVVSFVFHQNTVLIGGHAITEIASGIIFFSLIGAVFGLFAYEAAQGIQMRAAIGTLSQPVMVFALSYAMLRELENFQHSSHHHQTAVDLWGKLLTYLRWTLSGGMSIAIAHFHGDVPSLDYPLASDAERFATTLHWNEVRKAEYDVVVGLNKLHRKLSQRVVKGLDVPAVKNVLRGIGNFFYASISRDDHAQLTWGYGELVRAMEIVNLLPLMAPEPKRAPVISIKVFTQGNVVVSFLAWWMLLQVLFAVVTFIAFRLFPALSMNAQALVTVVAGPIAGAIAIVVGVSRKSSG